MTVLFVSHSVNFNSGANRSMIQLILELRELYHVNPLVLVPLARVNKGDYGLEKTCQDYDFDVVRSICPWMNTNKIWLQKIKYIIFQVYSPFLVKKLKKYNIDLVHTNVSVIDIGAKISEALGVPHIWHLREFGTETESVRIKSEEYLGELINKCSAFIAISNVIMQSYYDRIPHNKIYLIYNGISLKKTNIQSSHQNHRVEIVMVGSIAEHKNQLEAVKAVYYLVSSNVLNFHLTFVGGGQDEYLHSIKKYIDDNSLEEYVSFLGSRNDVSEILSQMDIGLMLSKSEAFGRVTVEYMFHNLAVIASDKGANVELIKNGETGFLYRFGDPMDLASKMKLLMNNRNLLCEISNKGRNFAVNNFTSEKNTAAVYKLYNDILLDE